MRGGCTRARTAASRTAPAASRSASAHAWPISCSPMGIPAHTRAHSLAVSPMGWWRRAQRTLETRCKRSLVFGVSAVTSNRVRFQQQQEKRTRGKRSHSFGLSSAVCACAAARGSQAGDELSL